MENLFLTNLNEQEFKNFLKEALNEIIQSNRGALTGEQNIPDILDIKQAAAFLHLKVNTLYEKTSEKSIPHFKKGNKLLFKRDELMAWVQEGKVKTQEELRGEASTYTLRKEGKKKVA